MSMQHIITSKSSALKTPTSSFKVSILSRYKGQPWDFPLPHCDQPNHGGAQSQGHQLSPHYPRLLLWYVNDTFVIQKAEHSNQFLQHMNTVDPHIQFTHDTADHQGPILFHDTLVTPGPDNTLLTTVYRKPTYTDQCLHWDIHHTFSANYSVFNTLTYRARTFSATPNCSSNKRSTLARLNPGQLPHWVLKTQN